MGAYASNIGPDAGECVSEFSHPSSADWITVHAAASDLAIVEVERLWTRFRKLGANDKGVIPPSVIASASPADSKEKMILETLQNAPDGVVTFQSFLNLMKWAESPETEKKVKAIFYLLNEGRPITKDILRQLLKYVYPEEVEPVIQRLCYVYMQQLDPNQKGGIDEMTFLRCVRSMPAETVDDLLSFSIIPMNISTEARQTIISGSNQNAVNPASTIVPDAAIGDAKLRRLAERLRRRDWHAVARKLRFTAEQVVKYENQYPNDAADQIYAMLLAWKAKAGSAATTSALADALNNCSMADVIIMLQS